MNIVEWDKFKDHDIFTPLGFKGDMEQVELATKAGVFIVYEHEGETLAFDLRGEIGWPTPTARCVTPWVKQETLNEAVKVMAAHGYVTLGIPVKEEDVSEKL